MRKFGTDNFDFLLQGVPTLEANQDAANYMENYHAMSDTFDKVDLTQMRKSVAAAAAIVLSIANVALSALVHAKIDHKLSNCCNKHILTNR